MSKEMDFTLEQQIDFAGSFAEGKTPDWYHMSEYHCTQAMLNIHASLIELKRMREK